MRLSLPPLTAPLLAFIVTFSVGTGFTFLTGAEFSTVGGLLTSTIVATFAYRARHAAPYSRRR